MFYLITKSLLLGSIYSLNIRLIYLIRDPRGTMVSRKRRPWCVEMDCSNAKVVCEDLESDYYAARRLAIIYPTRFK